MTPHAFDLAVLFIILLSTATAYFRGIIREFFILAGLILAVVISSAGGHFLVPGLDKWLGATGGHEKATIMGLLKPSMAANIVSYGGIFLLVFGLMIVTRILVTRAIQDAGLLVVDRILGGIFGFLRGFLFVFVIYVTCFYLITPSAFPKWVKDSYSMPVFDKTLVWTNKHVFDLNHIIEDKGSSIALKFNKVDLDKVGKAADSTAKKVKSEVSQPADKIEQTPPPAPQNPPQVAPKPAPQPAPTPAPVPPVTRLPPPSGAPPQTPPQTAPAGSDNSQMP